MADSLNEAPGEAYGGEMPALTTQLMGRVKAGDEGAFDQLVSAVTPRGNTVALTLVGSREDALDLVQESLTKIYAARESYRQEAPFLPWFHRILRNTCVSFLRKKGRVTTIEAKAPTPGEQAESVDTSTRVRAALDTLPLKHREILSLRHFEELSYSEISLHLGIPEGTVMSRLYHARQRLSERLGDLLEP